MLNLLQTYWLGGRVITGNACGEVGQENPFARTSEVKGRKPQPSVEEIS